MITTSNNRPIRSFVAIELPEEVKLGLCKIQADLQLPGHTFVKWVAPEAMHLTLKFLGNISPQKVAEIAKTMEAASRGFSVFRLTLDGVGAFPNLRRPRVLWVGVEGELDKLLALQQGIDRGLESLGFVPEARPFIPHLTLARLREGAPPTGLREFGDLVTRMPMKGGYEIVANSINLMKSLLLPSGAVYSCLTKVELKG